MRLLVSMGRKPGADRRHPLRPMLVELDMDRGVVCREQAFTLPGWAGAHSHQELTAATFDASGALLQAAHTDVLRIDPRSLSVVDRITHPAFHSVHSAAPTPSGGVVVTAASTDRVLWVSPSGALERELRLGGAVPQGDLRGLDHDALKPHTVHPNHASYAAGTLWITGFEPRAAFTADRDRTIPLPEAMPHDGRLREGLLWFTQVTGRVVGVDPHTLERRVDLDLAALTGERRMLGWCRGIEVVGHRLFVGFTMLRRTRHREVLRLMVRGIRGQKLPSRVMEIDLGGPRVVRTVEVGNAAGGTVYGLNAVRTADALNGG